MVNESDASDLNIKESDLLSFDIDGQQYRLPAKISSAMTKGMAGLPYGLKGMPFVELPEWAILKKE
jgi:hypothetical protein